MLLTKISFLRIIWVIQYLFLLLCVCAFCCCCTLLLCCPLLFCGQKLALVGTSQPCSGINRQWVYTNNKVFFLSFFPLFCATQPSARDLPDYLLIYRLSNRGNKRRLAALKISLLTSLSRPLKIALSGDADWRCVINFVLKSWVPWAPYYY